MNDEVRAREIAGLRPLSPEAIELWESQAGVRQPIALSKTSGVAVGDEQMLVDPETGEEIAAGEPVLKNVLE